MVHKFSYAKYVLVCVYAHMHHECEVSILITSTGITKLQWGISLSGV